MKFDTSLINMWLEDTHEMLLEGDEHDKVPPLNEFKDSFLKEIDFIAYISMLLSVEIAITIIMGV